MTNASKETCPECEEGVMQRKEVNYVLHGVTIGRYPALVCSKCGAQYFEDEAVDRIDAEVKKKGLWGLEAKTKVAELGNSYAVRIPKQIFDFLGLKKGKEVTITAENRHKIVITV